MTTAPTSRAFLGFVAGALAVLTFHQGMVSALHLAALTPGAAYRIMPVPPFGVPSIVSLSFWGGLYGALFGLIAPRLKLPLWLCGIGVGLVAALVAMFVVAPLKGHAIAYGWAASPIGRSLLINGVWGLGLGLILPFLWPRSLDKTTGQAATGNDAAGIAATEAAGRNPAT
jgi:hypothetical protein